METSMRSAMLFGVLAVSWMAMSATGCTEKSDDSGDAESSGDDGSGDDGGGDDGSGDGGGGDDGSGDGGGDDGSGDDGGSSVVYADVSPILDAHCNSCHTAGGSAPFALDSYSDASSRSGRLIARAVDGDGSPMPPSGLTLSAEEADTLVAWDAAGAPE